MRSVLMTGRVTIDRCKMMALCSTLQEHRTSIAERRALVKGRRTIFLRDTKSAAKREEYAPLQMSVCGLVSDAFNVSVLATVQPSPTLAACPLCHDAGEALCACRGADVGAS